MRRQSTRARLAIVLSLVLVAAVALPVWIAGAGTHRAAALSGKLRVVSNWTGAEGAAFKAVIAGFTAKNPGVQVEIQQVPFDQTEAFLTQQFASGSPPDVSVALPGIVRTLSGQKLLLNLDDLWSRWVASRQYNSSLRAIAQGSDGHTDAVFFKGNINALMWYKPAELRKIGGRVPHTWAQFVALLARAKQKGVEPVMVGGADQWPLTQWVDPVILRVAGPEAFNALARGKIRWSDKRVVRAFTVLGGLIKDYWAPNALSTKFIDEACGWANGKALLDNQGAFINLIVPGQCNSKLKPGRDFTFFEMPKYRASAPNAQFVSGDLLVGAKATANPEATKALLAYLGSAPAQAIWARRGGFIAPNARVSLRTYPNVNDRKAAALWPKSPTTKAGYDLDDWIGGRIQVRYRQALAQFVRDQDVDSFISTMDSVDTRSTR
jgi:ABC-type glycerol-3-phosphate transport system substrate-binding protein